MKYCPHRSAIAQLSASGLKTSWIANSLKVPAHGARLTVAFLDVHVPGYSTKDEWPSNSFDLNPLDFSVPGYIEEKLRTKKVSSLVNLAQELVKIWDSLDQDYLRRTVDSVVPRLRACVKAKGGHLEQLL
ncbi:hypothetical protein Y032_0026g1482 [Ancylostoma ceylanicum]|uniref:Uncharacterized protein n=1 Tax=Ancylostoma ceylanicum TaxID=53326 RepID=A0A016UWW6_9BILA|nr:hypothetical protein Y032_0026g1482 [Ancylostoma ceylanicum]